MHDATQFFDLLTKPLELFLGDAVVFRVARFDVGFPELLEPCAIFTIVARPDVGQAWINTLGLRAQPTASNDFKVRREAAAGPR